MQPFDGIAGARQAPLAWRQAGEGEQSVARRRQRPPGASSHHLRMNALRRSSPSFGVAAQIMSVESAETSSCR